MEQEKKSPDGEKREMKNALIVSSEKWNNVLKNLNRDDDTKKKIEDEKNFKKYLKDGSEEIKSKWPTRIIKRTPGNKIEQQRQKLEEKMLKDKEHYKEIQENEKILRKEKINKAKELILQVKPGPRELDSAAICSEVIKGREIQKTIKTEFEIKLKEEEKKENEKIQAQNKKWDEDQQKRIVEMKKRNEKYRTELQKQIDNNQKTKTEYAEYTKECEKILKEKQQKDLLSEVEREKAILDRKKEALRKSALEATKIMEQRRLREKMEETVLTKVAEIYNEGKMNIVSMTKEKQKQMRDENMKKIEKNMKNLEALKEQQEDQETKRLKAAEEFKNKLNEWEKNKIEKAKKRKSEKIKAYMEEKERQKLEQEKKDAKLKWDIANRLKNEEINQEFYKLQAGQKIINALEVKSILSEQIREKRLRELKEKEMDKLYDASQMYREEDLYFLNQANKLIQNAYERGRPTFPIIRVVEEYKKRNNIGGGGWVERKFLPKAGGRGLKCNCKPTSQPVIKYDLNELKQLKPVNAPVEVLWA